LFDRNQLENHAMTRIRKNGLDELYLSRAGQWVEWKLAAKFSSENAAERFAIAHGVEIFGLF